MSHFSTIFCLRISHKCLLVLKVSIKYELLIRLRELKSSENVERLKSLFCLFDPITSVAIRWTKTCLLSTKSCRGSFQNALYNWKNCIETKFWELLAWQKIRYCITFIILYYNFKYNLNNHTVFCYTKNESACMVQL